MAHLSDSEPNVPTGDLAHSGDLDCAADLVSTAGRLLATPGLVVITGGPGAGRSSVLRQLADAYRGPVFTGGGLAMLRTTPALALTRAVRVRLPAHDPALLAEAVRSRVRGGLLLVDDLHWADPATLAALPLLAAHCRIAAALRTPHRLPPAIEQALRDAATGWLAVPPLTAAAATKLIRRTAPGLDEAGVSAVLARAGGVPLAVLALARHAQLTQPHTRTSAPQDRGVPAGPLPTNPPPTAEPDSSESLDQVTYALAQALADLTRPARTAMAALGLLGRPATAATLGTGVAELAAAGLVTVTDKSPAGTAARSPVGAAQPPAATVIPATAEAEAVSPYAAEVAAGLLDPPARQALHRQLAKLVPPAEATRHLAAAGDNAAAYHHALAAAGQARTSGEQADLLLLACQLPGLPATLPPPAVRLDAARAALACGRPYAAAKVLNGQNSPAARVLHGEALLLLGETKAAREAVAGIPDDAPTPEIAGRDRILLLTTSSPNLPQQIIARHGDQPAHSGLRAALAATRAARRTPGWEHALASAAAAAGAAGDPLTARWSAWLLVETLAADGRLAEAARTAGAAASACAADLAYSWQTRFLAAELWCRALHGDTTAGYAATDDNAATSPDNIRRGAGDLLRRARNLTNRTLPTPASGYAAAAASLLEADGGQLADARDRLARVPAQPPAIAALLDWVTREAAWLDGQPSLATATPPTDHATPLIDGLRRITARWAAYDIARDLGESPQPGDSGSCPASSPLAPIRETLTAWAGNPSRFAYAAQAWRNVATREEVRCLLAQGLHCADPAQAIPPLLAAERLADEAGLTVLAGRVRQTLRRHAAQRPPRKHPLPAPRPAPGSRGATETGVTAAAAGFGGSAGTRPGESGIGLTPRERDVLRLVARGEPTRRIARQLGISDETVETHVRAGMRKLGARTRTEAAALALEMVSEQEEAV